MHSAPRLLSVTAATTVVLAAAIGCSTDSTTDDSPAGISVAWKKAPAEYQEAIVDAIEQFGCGTHVTADIIASEIYAASNFKAAGVSVTGARGPAQLMPDTWDRYAEAVNAHDITSPVDSSNVLVAHNCSLAKELTTAGIEPTTSKLITAYVAGVAAAIDPMLSVSLPVQVNTRPLIEAVQPAIIG